MLKVLIVKMSSLGDVLHTLPALTDAARALPGIRFDWVVEEAYAEIPAWHPAVDTVIPLALRRWRRQPLQAIAGGEWAQFRARLRATQYDAVIDAQGLIKSALITRLARGVRCGLDRHSAREPLAALAYDRKYAIGREQHAIERVRQLFAAALDYPLPAETSAYGIDRSRLGHIAPASHSVVFLHGASWASKQWPESYWRQLCRLVTDAGFSVELPWGDDMEHARAQRIAAESPQTRVLPRMGMTEMARTLAQAQGVIAVDTGLAHLAAALSVPCVTLYGATRPALTGTRGIHQAHLCAEFPCSPCLSRTCNYRATAPVEPACYQTLPPEQVWRAARELFDAC